ncbi:YbaN family protein [Marinomonas profundimaris]|uniref:Inner membrane protein n=1 Tax=Marinomonas profundimaris TaxID=1208321 RepID=W1S164_9GAMM|nr:YbaN family protein [Marinomonas profundimaris]ETI60808.1 hypothetical protein D104_08925 [Marinomonas profundimaris]
MMKTNVFIYQIIAVLSLIMVCVGILVPGIPATEFILLCAWSSSKGSPRIHRFLHHNKFTGPAIDNWNNGKLISKKNKVFSSVSMFLCAFLLIYTGVNQYVLFFALLGMSVGFIWIWSRPNT